MRSLNGELLRRRATSKGFVTPSYKYYSLQTEMHDYS